MTSILEFQSYANDLIDEWGSDITFTPISKSTTYGGYSGSETETTASAVETKAIPSSFISRRYGMEKFGDLESGNARVVIKKDITFTSGVEYKATWDNQSWNVVSIQNRGHFQNELAFKVVELSKQI